jgi:hypothetical protein
MGSPLFKVDGMLRADGPLAIEHLVDFVVVDSAGRLLVDIVDLLAMLRIDVDAELLLVTFRDGSSRALPLPEVVDSDGLFLEVHLSGQRRSGDEPWSVRLWSSDTGPSSCVESIRAMSFASFVGQA